MEVVFAKTRKGIDEIEHRHAGLGPRVRRVLIFIDGKRTVEELRTVVQSDDLLHTLGMLEEDGFIEMASVVGPKGELLAPDQPLPSVTAFKDHAPDPTRQQMARNFMLNTLKTFVGTVGTTSLQRRIETAMSQSELRTLFDEWFYVIVSSQDGRREAEQLRTKLLEVI
ncbi:hypothetical protein [Zoogloea sp.]|uniref:hypothetical protein n=2 Tax=Zoogloea sp. TaxID=49181 RepID=UPI0035B1B7BB